MILLILMVVVKFEKNEIFSVDEEDDGLWNFVREFEIVCVYGYV